MMFTALKKSEDDNSITLRMTDMSGAEQNIELEMFMPLTKIYKTNLIEEEEKVSNLSGKSFNLKVGKNSIETFKLKLE